MTTPLSSKTLSGLSDDCLSLFLAFARDAGDWGGTPLVGGNVTCGRRENGFLTDLKKKGLIVTDEDEGDVWLRFTPTGKAMAKTFGVDLDWIDWIA